MKKHLIFTLGGLIIVMLFTSGFAWRTVESGEEVVAYESIVTHRGSVTKLGNYKGVEVTMLSTEVTNGELEKKIQDILAANPQYADVTHRPAQFGDTVVIDYKGIMDGKELQGGTDFGYPLELGSGMFIDGFEDGLVGANVGEVRNLNLVFSEKYPIDDLAGKSVMFVVTIHGIREKKDAVLDLDFVRSMSELDTVDAWKASILADMKSAKEAMAEARLKEDGFEAVLMNSEFELNEVAVNQVYNRQMDEYSTQIQMSGMSWEDFMLVSGMTEEEFYDQLRKSSELLIKQELLVQTIAKQEGLKIEAVDYETLTAEYLLTAEQMIGVYGREAVDDLILRMKVTDLIKANARVR